MNRVNSRELVGKGAYIPSGLETCLYESKNIRLRLLREYIDSKFINFWFQFFSQQYFNRNVAANCWNGVNKSRSNLVQCLFLCHIYILEQRKIVAKIESLFSIANRIEQVAKEAKMKIERIYMSILARAYRGKLLKQDPND